MASARAALIWAALLVVVVSPIVAAALSPLLAWRDSIYIMAGFAGIIALSLMLVQPLLIGGYLPGVSAPFGRWAHRWVGGVLAVLVLLHVAGLWITSPPDVIDALLFNSPTPFSLWGVIAMWAVMASALLAIFRRNLRLRPRTWRFAHLCISVVIVLGTVLHTILIEGAMETVSKLILCLLLMLAVLKVMADFKLWLATSSQR